MYTIIGDIISKRNYANGTTDLYYHYDRLGNVVCITDSYGNWITEEPTGADGPNLYHFVYNNPINMVDYNGLDATPIHAEASLFYGLVHGYGFWGSMMFAAGNISEDLFQPEKNNPVAHGMAAPGQTNKQAAINASMNYAKKKINSECSFNLYAFGAASHTAQDAGFWLHGGKPDVIPGTPSYYVHVGIEVYSCLNPLFSLYCVGKAYWDTEKFYYQNYDK